MNRKLTHALRTSSLASWPEVHQLATFLKVAEARSFIGAARLLGRSQPAISQAIARLEEIYGGDLFERRRGAPLRLTPIGEAILPSARTIIDTIEQQMVSAVAAAQSRAGTLTLGIFPGLMAASPLRGGISEFVRTSPQVALRLAEALPDELHRRLNERAIDLMVVALLPKLESNTLTQERLWDEMLALALPSGHQFADRDDLMWADIAALPVILKTSSVELLAYRALLEESERRVHLQQHDVSCSTLLDMVALGLGATIVFASGTVPHPGVVFRRIAEDNAAVSIDAIWPKDDRNPLRYRLLSLIRAHKDDAPVGPLIPPTKAPAPDHD